MSLFGERCSWGYCEETSFVKSEESAFRKNWKVATVTRLFCLSTYILHLINKHWLKSLTLMSLWHSSLLWLFS